MDYQETSVNRMDDKDLFDVNKTTVNGQTVYNIPEMRKKEKGGMGVASLVFGILSIVLCCVWYVGLIFAVLGFILGLISYKANKGGVALAGIITSSVGLVFGILGLVITICSPSQEEIIEMYKKYLEELLGEEEIDVEFIGRFLK